MIMQMKLALYGFLLFSLAPVALAFNPISPEPTQPYEPIVLEGDAFIERELLGTLDNYPVMYELTTDVAMDLVIKILQRADENVQPMNLIVVRDNEGKGGVVEVARLNQTTDKWTQVENKTVAATFIQSRTMNLSIPPGTYRIEVSTPDNVGNYMLIVGDEPTSVNYFKTLGNIFETQRHFEYSIFRFFLSPYVYVPLLIILIIGGLYYYYRPPKYSKYGT